MVWRRTNASRRSCITATARRSTGSPAPWVLSGDSFFEPRFVAKGKNSNFRGLDMRLYATASYEAEKKTCVVSCGDRKTDA